MTERDRFIVGTPLGRWQTNCYVIGDRSAGRAVVIDPGEDGSRHVPAVLEQTDTVCDAILLTHGHLDHFWSAPELGRVLDVPVLMHEEDRWLWENPTAGFGMDPSQGTAVLEAQFGLAWDSSRDFEPVRDGQRLTFAGIDLDVAHNPGHTPGHVTYLGRGLGAAEVAFAFGRPEVASDVLFSGDLIFEGSIGRTDFPRGSTQAIFRSLIETVLPLDDDTVILSGHGGDTTVARERATNPFLHQALRAVGS